MTRQPVAVAGTGQVLRGLAQDVLVPTSLTALVQGAVLPVLAAPAP